MERFWFCKNIFTKLIYCKFFVVVLDILVLQGSYELLHKFDIIRLSSILFSKNLKMKIYRAIILPVVLYGCETWYVTLREECMLRVFENRILK